MLYEFQMEYYHSAEKPALMIIRDEGQAWWNYQPIRNQDEKRDWVIFKAICISNKSLNVSLESCWQPKEEINFNLWPCWTRPTHYTRLTASLRNRYKVLIKMKERCSITFHLCQKGSKRAYIVIWNGITLMEVFSIFNFSWNLDFLPKI